MRTLLFLWVLVPSLVIGADHQSAPRPVMDHSTRSVDGRLEPGAIPLWRKMDALLQRYPNELSEHLEAEDHPILLTLKREREWLEAAQGVLGLVRQRQAACFVTSKAENIAGAVTFDALANQDKERLYSDFLNLISETGQAAIHDYLDREITPTIQHSETDWQAFLDAMPRRESDNRWLQEQCFKSLEWRAVIGVKTDDGALVISRGIR